MTSLEKQRTGRTALLYVVPHIYPDVIGGIGLCAHEFATALSQKFDVTVVSAWTSDKNPGNSLPYHLVSFRVRSPLSANPISSAMAWWITKHVPEFDLVHLHSHLFLISALGALQARIASRPTFLTNHGIVSHSYPVSAQRAWTRAVLRTAFRGCDRLICYTKADAAEYLQLGAHPEQISIVPYGIDINRFPLVTRRTTRPLRLLWIGRMAPEKGLMELLRGLALSKDFKAQGSLTLVGDGPQCARLQELVKSLGLSANVSFVGRVLHENVPVVLSEHDALILPSLAEGLPRIALEAMATGMPVLCSFLPQLREAFGDSVAYFDPRSAKSIEGAIREACTDRSRLLLLGLMGRRLVEKEYSLEVAVERLVGVYALVLPSIELAGS